MVAFPDWFHMHDPNFTQNWYPPFRAGSSLGKVAVPCEGRGCSLPVPRWWAQLIDKNTGPSPIHTGRTPPCPILQDGKRYMLGIKPGGGGGVLGCYSHSGRNFLCTITDIGAHSILLYCFFALCGDFAQIFKQSTLKIPGKPRENKRKEIWTLRVLFRSDGEGFFCVCVYPFDSHLIRWFQFLNKNSIPLSSGSNTRGKKISTTEVLRYIISANPGSIPYNCVRDVKDSKQDLNIDDLRYRCWYDYRDVCCLKPEAFIACKVS